MRKMAPNSMSEAGPSGCVVKTKKESEGKEIQNLNRFPVTQKAEYEQKLSLSKSLKLKKYFSPKKFVEVNILITLAGNSERSRRKLLNLQFKQRAHLTKQE